MDHLFYKLRESSKSAHSHSWDQHISLQIRLKICTQVFRAYYSQIIDGSQTQRDPEGEK